VAGFTGGDTYFNAGTINGAFQVTGGLTALSVTSTQIVVLLTHANAVAGTNGTILQMGNSTTSCGGLSTLYTDSTLGTPSLINPVVSDGYGNYGFWATPGQYYLQYYGPTVTTTIRPITVPGTGGSITGTITSGQVAFGTAPNTIGGTASFLWGTPFAGALNLTTATIGTVGSNGALLALLNSNAGNTTYIGKNSGGTFYISNDGASIPALGFFSFDSVGNVQLLGGGNAASMQFNVAAGVLPAGSVNYQMPSTGVGTATFGLNTPGNATSGAYKWVSGQAVAPGICQTLPQ
jgi:hypothetical protein